jgi:hypothetical protein
MVLSAPSPGAEISTRLDPFSRCAWHFSFEVKMPVHSITMSTPPQGSSAGLRIAVTSIGPRPTSMVEPGHRHRGGKAAVHAVVAQEMRVGLDRARGR